MKSVGSSCSPQRLSIIDIIMPMSMMLILEPMESCHWVKLRGKKVSSCSIVDTYEWLNLSYHHLNAETMNYSFLLKDECNLRLFSCRGLLWRSINSPLLSCCVYWINWISSLLLLHLSQSTCSTQSQSQVFCTCLLFFFRFLPPNSWESKSLKLAA